MAHVMLLWLLPQLLGKGNSAVHYTKTEKVGISRKLTIVYGDLYPGLAFDFSTKQWTVDGTPFGKAGGCTFQDATRLGSPLPLLEDKADHVTVGALRGHLVKFDCNWNIPQSNRERKPTTP